MSRNTPIEWTDDSWPVIAGCKECSPGCAECYAARLTATRLKNQPKYKGLAVIGQNGHPHFTGDVRFWAPHLDWPLKWKEPRRIFPANMSDLFYEEVTNEEIAAVFGVMAACPHHTFQVLTKRADRLPQWFEWVAERARRNAPADENNPWWAVIEVLAEAQKVLGKPLTGAGGQGWPLRNVWLGVSVENQEYADKRIPHLLRTPAAVRFLSCEPLLDPVNLRPWFKQTACDRCTLGVMDNDNPHLWGACRCDCHPRPDIDWVIVGGESGPGARPFDLAWARSIVSQCKAAGVACFIKQLGLYAVDGLRHDVAGQHPTVDAAPSSARAWKRGEYGPRVALKDRKGGDMSEWPADLRVREFPHSHGKGRT